MLVTTQFEFGCPPDSLLFGKVRQLPQHMHIADGMLARILEIRTKAIMDAGASIVGQDPNGFQRLLPSTGVDLRVGEPGGTRDMHPVAFACHVSLRFHLAGSLPARTGLL